MMILIGNWPSGADLQESTVVELAMAISCKARLLYKQAGKREGAAHVGTPHVHGAGKATTGERLAQQVCVKKVIV